MSSALQLKEPQQYFDWLVPASRDKFRLEEVAQILSPDGSPGDAISVQSIRNGLESGQIFGSRLNFAAEPGKEQRFRGMLTRADVLQFILATRTAPPADQLAQLLRLIETLPDEALRHLQIHAGRVIVRRAQPRPPTSGDLF